MSDSHDPMAQHWQAKRDWHAEQRQRPLHEKIEAIVDLQRRQVAINGMKVSLGLPTIPMRVWGEP